MEQYLNFVLYIDWATFVRSFKISIKQLIITSTYNLLP